MPSSAHVPGSGTPSARPSGWFRPVTKLVLSKAGKGARAARQMSEP